MVFDSSPVGIKIYQGGIKVIYGYARVSSIGQDKYGNSLESQEQDLKANGAEKIFVDTFTGTKLDRPEFQKLLDVVHEGDTILATKLDRVSRSASQGIALVDKLLSKGITLHILNMGVMNNTPTGKLIRNVMFSFAEFERDMIVQRTMEGKAICKATKPGWRVGRKPVEVDDNDLRKLRDEVKKGTMTVIASCKALGISRSTWYNLCKGA